jgi:hypothetical protein
VEPCGTRGHAPVLKYYFKPNRRTVYLSKSGIEAAWVPRIRNVNIVLVDGSLPGAAGRDGYMFESIARKADNTYSISFGYGALGCGDRTGDHWSFLLSLAGQVRSLRPTGLAWGPACTPHPPPPRRPTPPRR